MTLAYFGLVGLGAFAMTQGYVLPGIGLIICAFIVLAAMKPKRF